MNQNENTIRIGGMPLFDPNVKSRAITGENQTGAKGQGGQSRGRKIAVPEDRPEHGGSLTTENARFLLAVIRHARRIPSGPAIPIAEEVRKLGGVELPGRGASEQQ